MKIYKKMMIISSISFFFTLVFILSIFFNKIILKNSQYVNVLDINGEVVKYDIYNKKVLIYSIDCEVCIDDLKFISQYPIEVQKNLDLFFISSFEETVNLITNLHIKGNIYIDFDQKLMKKANVSLTPSYIIFKDKKPKEVYDLKKFIE